MSQTDHCVRAITNDGSYRVITIQCTETVQSVLDAQKATGHAARLLGELLTSAVLVREMMSPGNRVQMIIGTKPHRFSFVADARPGGLTRGLMSVPEGQVVDLGQGVFLQVLRVLYDGQLHQGIVATDQKKGIPGSLCTYMLRSEQTNSLADIGCVFDEEGRVASAGGYIIQLLPEADEAAIALMAARAEGFRPVSELLSEGSAAPDMLLDDILEHFPFTILDRSKVYFGCDCSQARVLAALATMPRQDIVELVSSGEVLQIGCDYCGENHQIGTEMLKSLLESN
jgi:molecular chaperone Hsp33